MLKKPEATAEKIERKEAVVVKKYANRRLYNTETSTYVTLEDLATMVRGDRDFVVYDAKTGDDLTIKFSRRLSSSRKGARAARHFCPFRFCASSSVFTTIRSAAWCRVTFSSASKLW